MNIKQLQELAKECSRVSDPCTQRTILIAIGEIEAAAKDASRWNFFVDYMLSDRTDLDDDFVACTTKTAINELVDKAIRNEVAADESGSQAERWRHHCLPGGVIMNILTDEEIEELYFSELDNRELSFARAIEAAVLAKLTEQHKVKFRRFCADVHTAAGLIRHGNRDKMLAQRLSEYVSDYYILVEGAQIG